VRFNRYPISLPTITQRIRKRNSNSSNRSLLLLLPDQNYDIVLCAERNLPIMSVRVSGAKNSIVAYCLGITDGGPDWTLDLYFERFINLYRENPPDFDIDFSWTDRDAVIAYIFSKKYNQSGHEHVALLGSLQHLPSQLDVAGTRKSLWSPKSEKSNR